MKTFIYLFVGVLLYSCSERTPLEFSVHDMPTENLNALSFERIKAEILTPDCIVCHKQYENYEAVKREARSILSAVEAERMPKNAPPLTLAQKDLLKTWVTAGAPLDGTTPLPTENDLKAEWKSLSENVFFPKCVNCHNPDGQAKFLDLSSRQAFFNQRNQDYGGKILIDFENPEESYLMEIINDENEPMPPRWSNLERLTKEEAELVQEWIKLGLP